MDAASAGQNFLLEERLDDQRQKAFADTGAGNTDFVGMRSAYGNYFEASVGVTKLRRRQSHTFGAINRPAIGALAGLESHRDVVRVESLVGLWNLNNGVLDSQDDLVNGLVALADGNATEHQREALAEWLEGANAKRDARPMFAAPWGEVQDLLGESDWANRIRSALGLVHLMGTPDKPLPIALMRYNLSRAEDAAKKDRMDWVAAPTVLEAGTKSGPNAAFCPFPEKALGEGDLGFGQTVDLGDGEGLDYKPELVHYRINYEFADFHRIGYITDLIDDHQLAAARERHLNLLENDFRHWGDLS